MTSAQDWNRSVIEEFRANEGKVKQFAGATVVLLTHTGRKSGTKRTNPLVAMPDGDRYLVFGSKGGAPQHPDWYWNLKANPDVTLEVGTEKFEATAEEVTGEERDRLWAKNVAARPGFGEYEKTAQGRVIPVIALYRRG